MSVWALPRSAWPISIALHVLLVAALSRVSMPVSNLEQRFEREILRFELRPRAAVDAIPAPNNLAPATLDEIAVPDRIVQRSIEPAPARVETLEPEAVIDERSEEPELEPDVVTPAPSVTTAVDFEAIRKEAIAGVIEQAERNASYRQFSLEDLIEETPTDATPQVPSVFEAESSGRSRAGPLSPGKQRTAIGRRLAEICSGLGGIGMNLFGFGLPLCAEPGARADAFGHLRPQYMNSLPVCTEVEPEDIGAGLSEEALEESLASSDEVDAIEPVIKCRLVPREERIDGARPERAR